MRGVGGLRSVPNGHRYGRHGMRRHHVTRPVAGDRRVLAWPGPPETTEEVLFPAARMTRRRYRPHGVGGQPHRGLAAQDFPVSLERIRSGPTAAADLRLDAPLPALARFASAPIPRSEPRNGPLLWRPRTIQGPAPRGREAGEPAEREQFETFSPTSMDLTPPAKRPRTALTISPRWPSGSDRRLSFSPSAPDQTETGDHQRKTRRSGHHVDRPGWRATAKKSSGETRSA
jgi:hypothetical protein